MSFAGVAEKRAVSFSREEMIDLWPHVVRQAVIDLKLGKPADKRSARAFLRRTGILAQAEKISPRRLRNAYYPRSGQWQRRPGYEVIDKSVFASKVDRRRSEGGAA